VLAESNPSIFEERKEVKDMKKWIFLVLALVLMINLTAMGIGCKAKEPEKPAVKEEQNPPETPAPAPPAPPEQKPEEKPTEAPKQ